ncbi:MAG TPA: TolC family protein, partial [Steroidobacteraceae bacterium]
MRKHAGTSAWARLVLAAGFVFCCAGTVAQATDPGEADAAFISLIAEAVRRQPELGTRQSSVAEARGSLSEAQAAFFPRVQLLVDSGEDRNVRGSDITRSRERGEINPQLALTQLLYDGGAAWGQLRAARERVDAASREIDGAANSLALQAVQIYFTVLRQREAVKIAEENLRRVRSVRDKVAGRADAGRDPRSELLRLGSRVLEARSQLTDAQRNLEDANAAFEEFFGYAPGELHVPRTYPMRRQSVEEALAYAREHSPELLALRSELEASAADADSARASMLWPRLSLE